MNGSGRSRRMLVSPTREMKSTPHRGPLPDRGEEGEPIVRSMRSLAAKKSRCSSVVALGWFAVAIMLDVFSEANRVLRRAGWRVVRIWEHELTKKNERRLVARLRRFWNGSV